MRFFDWLDWIWRAARASRLRTWLTALGIAIGITAVSLLTAIGEGVHGYVLVQFNQFGTHIVSINPGKTETGGGMTGLLRTERALTIEDALALAKVPSVTAMVPIVQGTGRVEAGVRQRDTMIMGVGSGAADAWQLTVQRGRFLPDDDPVAPRAYAVLGHKVWRELYAERSPLGEHVRIGGQRYRVVGLMAPKGQMLGFDMDDIVYIPAARGLALFNREGLMEINFKHASGVKSATMVDRLKQALLARHGGEDFTITSQEDMLKTLDRILSVLKVAIGALGGISLFVGGVGVLTIMTTALAERRQEIGLLRALGCTRRQLLTLFLGESIALATLGGLLGLVLLAVLIGLLMVGAPGLPLAPQPFYLLLALALSALVGALAGIWPAWQAAQVDPIDALRAE
ncbi:MAG: ABC transporter permease [Pseudomonadota bacterium]